MFAQSFFFCALALFIFKKIIFVVRPDDSVIAKITSCVFLTRDGLHCPWLNLTLGKTDEENGSQHGKSATDEEYSLPLCAAFLQRKSQWIQLRKNNNDKCLSKNRIYDYAERNF